MRQYKAVCNRSLEFVYFFRPTLHDRCADSTDRFDTFTYPAHEALDPFLDGVPDGTPKNEAEESFLPGSSRLQVVEAADPFLVPGPPHVVEAVDPFLVCGPPQVVEAFDTFLGCMTNPSSSGMTSGVLDPIGVSPSK